MKRLLSLLCAVVLCLCVFSACSIGENDREYDSDTKIEADEKVLIPDKEEKTEDEAQPLPEEDKTAVDDKARAYFSVLLKGQSDAYEAYTKKDSAAYKKTKEAVSAGGTVPMLREDAINSFCASAGINSDDKRIREGINRFVENSFVLAENSFSIEKDKIIAKYDVFVVDYRGGKGAEIVSPEEIMEKQKKYAEIEKAENKEKFKKEEIISLLQRFADNAVTMEKEKDVSMEITFEKNGKSLIITDVSYV